MEKVELRARYIAPPRLIPSSALLILNLFPWFPFLVNLWYPLNVSVLLRLAKMAPPFIAELLLKLLAPLKVSLTQLTVESAPPLDAALLLKTVVPMNVNEMLIFA